MLVAYRNMSKFWLRTCYIANTSNYKRCFLIQSFILIVPVTGGEVSLGQPTLPAAQPILPICVSRDGTWCCAKCVCRCWKSATGMMKRRMYCCLVEALFRCIVVCFVDAFSNDDLMNAMTIRCECLWTQSHSQQIIKITPRSTLQTANSILRNETRLDRLLGG